VQLQTQSIVVCFLFRVGQNRLFTPYMTVTSPPKKSKFKCIILACLILLLAQSSNASAIGRQGISFQVIPLAQHPPASYFVCVQQGQRYWTAGHFFSGYTTRTAPSCFLLCMCAAMPALLDGRPFLFRLYHSHNALLPLALYVCSNASAIGRQEGVCERCPRVQEGRGSRARVIGGFGLGRGQE